MVRLVTIAAVVMGVLIVGGTATLLVLLIGRAPAGGASGPAIGPAVATLDEPAGTRIAGAAGTAEALVLRLQGGGPDRVVVLDVRSGRIAARVGLAR